MKNLLLSPFKLLLDQNWSVFINLLVLINFFDVDFPAKLLIISSKKYIIYTNNLLIIFNIINLFRGLILCKWLLNQYNQQNKLLSKPY